MPTYHILHSPWKTFLLQTDIAMAVTFVLASAVTGSFLPDTEFLLRAATSFPWKLFHLQAEFVTPVSMVRVRALTTRCILSTTCGSASAL